MSADAVQQHVKKVGDFVLYHSSSAANVTDSQLTRIAAHYEEKIRARWWSLYNKRMDASFTACILQSQGYEQET